MIFLRTHRFFSTSILPLAGLMLAVAPLSSPLLADYAVLSSGGKLQGEVASSNDKILLLNSTAASQPLSLKIAGLQSVILDNEPDNVPFPDKITLSTGDSIPCKIVALEGGTITFQAFSNKEMALPLEQIGNILFSANESRTLIAGPQSLAAEKTAHPPAVPDFFSPNELIRPEENKGDEDKQRIRVRGAGGRSNSFDEIISSDNWLGAGVSGWRWRGAAPESSLEIPASRGIISKDLRLSDYFSLSGSYLGSAKSATNLFQPQNQAKNRGVSLIIGGTREELFPFFYSNTFSSQTKGEFYILELLPAGISLYRISGSKGDKQLLASGKVEQDKNNKSYNYDFELKGKGMEFELYINKKLVSKCLDSNEIKITQGRFSVANMEYTPVILKNLTLTARKKSILENIREILPAGKPPETSFLLTNDGNIFPGELVKYLPDANSIEWHVQNDPGVAKIINLSFIAALITGTESPAAGGVKLHFADDGQISGDLLSLDGGEFKLQHPLLQEIGFPRSLIRRMDFRPAAQNTPSPEAPAGAPSANEGVLTLINGDNLPASIQDRASESTLLGVVSPVLEGSASFYVNKLDSFKQAGLQTQLDRNGEAFMTNGDGIRGTLRVADAKKIQLQTTWGGQLSLDRNKITGMAIHPQESLIFDGTQTTPQWTPKSPWTIEGNNFRNNSSTETLAGEFATRKKLRLSFTYNRTNSSSFSIRIWANEQKSPTSCYTFSLHYNSIQIRKSIENSTSTIKTLSLGDRFASSGEWAQGKKINVDLFCNQETDSFLLYLDGVAQTTWHEGQDVLAEIPVTPPPAKGQDTGKDKLGAFLLLSSMNKNSVVVENFRVSEWNGVSPGDELMDLRPPAKNKIPPSLQSQEGNIPRTNVKETEPSKRSLVQLKNGDLLKGTISAGNDKELTVQTRQYNVNVPLNRIMGIRFLQKESLQRLYNNDVRAWFPDGSSLTFWFKKCADGVITGYSEALGNISIQLSEVNGIEFNLYNEELKKARAEQPAKNLDPFAVEGWDE